MAKPATTVTLASLDEFQPATCDPHCWTANLAALEQMQPAWADALRRISLPDSWRPATALDDSTTYRTEPEGAEAIWLAGTAAPQRRAAALLVDYKSDGRNPALPSIGAGAELVLLLRHLPGHIAIFVFESDPRAIAAVLRLYDLSAAIAGLRCILVPPENRQAYLDSLLNDYPGLLPPGQIVLPDLVSADQLADVRALCERTFTETHQRRNVRIAELSAACSAESAAPGSTPRLAVLALGGRPAPRAVAHMVECAARRNGWDVALCTAATPDAMHPLVHCEAVVALRPTITLHLGHKPSLLPMTPPGETCVWYDDIESVPEDPPARDSLHLAGTPAVAAALRRAGAPLKRARDWFWACGVTDDEPSTTDMSHDGSVVLVGDLPAADPRAYELKQESHRRLWDVLREKRRADWETPRRAVPEQLLKETERVCGVKLADRTLRESILRLIDTSITPGVILEQVVEALTRAKVFVRTLGRGWQRLVGEHLEVLGADPVLPSDDTRSLRPCACVLADGRDPLRLALVQAAARGWPVLLHTPGGKSWDAALGGVLRRDEHYNTFVGLDDFWKTLELLRERTSDIQERASRAAAHVRAHHSVQRRLQELAEYVGCR